MTARQLAIYGSGGFAREVAWLVEACNRARQLHDVVCYVDDDVAKHGSLVHGLPVMGLEECTRRYPAADIVGAIGSPAARQACMERAGAAGHGFVTFVHPNVERSNHVQIGEGTVICAGSTLTTDIVIGQHAQINLHCTVGHDAIIGDFATLAPGVHVSGWVHVGQRVYVGTGAVILNGRPGSPIVIGDDSVIGAAACVTKSIPAGITVVGVPAKPLLRD